MVSIPHTPLLGTPIFGKVNFKKVLFIKKKLFKEINYCLDVFPFKSKKLFMVESGCFIYLFLLVIHIGFDVVLLESPKLKAELRLT